MDIHADDLVEQVIHTDTILEMTGEYSSDSMTKEERIAHKLNAYFHASSVEGVKSHAKRSSQQLTMDEAELGDVKAAVTRAGIEDFVDDCQDDCSAVEENNDTTAPAPRASSEAPAWHARANLRTYRNFVKTLRRPSTTDNDDTAPGAYMVTPRNRPSQDDDNCYDDTYNYGEQDIEDEASCVVQPDAPMSLAELEQAALTKMSHSRCRRTAIIMTVMLIVLAITGLLLFRHSLMPSAALYQDPSIVEQWKTSCSLQDIYSDCQIEGVTSFRSTVPDCAFSQYMILMAGFVPRELSDVATNSDIISCAPDNLALLTLAANGEESRNKFILNTMYFATSGHKWGNNTNWLSAESECSWFNVTCHTNGSIAEIRLIGNNLEGALPSVIGLLDALEVLELTNNFLASSIPESLSSLSKLQDLYLDFNFFDMGPVPSSLLAIKSLQTLSLVSTQRTGIPSHQLIGMTNLRKLDLELNLFTSETIPSELFSLTNLELLNLKATLLAGTLSNEISHLTALKELDLSSCSLTGTFPSEIGLLTSLSALGFSENNFVGTIPTEVCSLWTIAPLKYFGDGDILSKPYFMDSFQVYGGLTCPSSECCPDLPHAK